VSDFFVLLFFLMQLTLPLPADVLQKILLLLLPFTCSSSILSITGRDQTGYTVYADFCMFPQSCDLRTETAGSL
jgi:hypothetical protein